MMYKNINFIEYRNKTHLSLFTFEYFIKNRCDKIRTSTINFFTKSTRKWEKNDDFFPDKFKDFHGCELNFGKKENNYGNFAPKKEEQFGGNLYEINEAITKQLNIKSKYLMCPVNKTLNRNVCPRNPEMFLQTAFINSPYYTQLEYFDFDNYAGFLIPPGKLIIIDFLSTTFHPFTGAPYSQFEKIFMMFDMDVWIAIAITFGGGLIIIQIINVCSEEIQNLVFGEGVRGPTLNFFGIIFGIGQMRLPTKNFARFLLMLFLFLCLILRTCHQSMLYDLMQKDLRQPEIETIEEAINQG
jgi:hypothetical protein